MLKVRLADRGAEEAPADCEGRRRRAAGGDASHDAKTHQFFNMHNVPEVFAYFDDFSYELSQLDLSNYRGNAMRNDIVAGARL